MDFRSQITVLCTKTSILFQKIHAYATSEVRCIIITFTINSYISSTQKQDEKDRLEKRTNRDIVLYVDMEIHENGVFRSLYQQRTIGQSGHQVIILPFKTIALSKN